MKRLRASMVAHCMLAAASASSGCTAFAGEHVSLGAADGRPRVLPACSGAACSAPGSATSTLDETDPTACQSSVAGGIEWAWQERLIDERTGQPLGLQGCGELAPCSLDYAEHAIAVSLDGSVWLAGVVAPMESATGFPSGNRIEQGVWLAHYSPDGLQQSAEILDFERVAPGELLSYSVSLAPDGESSVLLGVFKRWAREGDTAPESLLWIARHGADGRRIGDPIIVPDDLADDAAPIPLQLARVNDGRFAVLAGRKLAWLEGTRLLWVIAEPDYAEAVLADGHQGITTFHGHSGFDPGGLRRYDSAGAIVWERALPRPLDRAQLGAGSGGHLFRSAELIEETTSTHLGHLLHRISEAGASIWLLQISPPLDPPRDYGSYGVTSAVEAHGRIWLAGPVYASNALVVDELAPEVDFATPEQGTLLYEISADGRECHAHELRDEFSTPRILAAPDGDLYVFNNEHFGRVRVP